MYTIKEKKDCLLLQLDEADRRFKLGISKMQEIKDRIDELEESRTLSLRKEFLINEIAHYEKINGFEKFTYSLKQESNLIHIDSRDEINYRVILNGYRSMSRRKNELEEERNSIVKDIETL